MVRLMFMDCIAFEGGRKQTVAVGSSFPLNRL